MWYNIDTMKNKSKTTENNKPKKRKVLCAAVFDRDGKILRILKTTDACSSWVKKHFPNESRPIKPFYTRKSVSNEFGNQMQCGLIDNLVIQQLLYFSGVYKNETDPKILGRR